MAHLVRKVTLFREKKALCKIFLINFWLFTVKKKNMAHVLLCAVKNNA